MKLLIYILYIVLLTSTFVKSDIPVHCLKSQVVGKWKFFLTTPEKKNTSEKYKHTCGHTNPSHEATSYKFNMNTNDFQISIEMELKDSDEVILTQENKKFLGTWTMVYDEGFDVIFNKDKNLYNDRSYFVFSKYGYNQDSSNNRISSKWVSYCYSTLIGWYYEGDKWGCMYGYKLGVNKNEITNGEAQNKLNVVEGEITKKDASNEVLYSTQKYYMDESSPKGEKVEPEVIESTAPQSQYYSTFSSDLASNNLKNKNLQKESIFLETKLLSDLKEKSELSLTTTAKFNEKFVESINSQNFLWKAENYEEFSHMSFKELNKFAGRNKKIKTRKSSHRERLGLGEKLNSNHMSSSLNKNKFKRKEKVENTEIPENFSWINYMTPARSQGSCGSCYAASTITMLEARLKKKYANLIDDKFPNKKDFSISLDHVLKCSYYNQGCDGGYSYLVSKFFNEFEMLLDSCYDKYSGGCSKNCKNSNYEKFTLRVANNRYVGGSYGRCSEDKILKEVYDNGPIVVSLEPDYSFMFYKSGIYMSPNNNWFVKELPKPEWEKVDHSVVLVGWGVEKINNKKVKYWILQNSWGSNWGENGFMKFIRGQDHLGIESICETADPIFTVEN